MDMIPFSQFSYWFIWNDETETYKVHSIKDEFKYIGHILMSHDREAFSELHLMDECNDSQTDVIVDFNMFLKGRPESVVRRAADIKYPELSGSYMQQNMQTYEDYIAGTALIAQMVRIPNVDPDSAYPTRCIEWLERSDFFLAPASTRYHESFPGGLCVHTLRVLNNALELLKLDKFKKCDRHIVARIALVHDWCKVGKYESFQKNVKNEETGVWEKVPAYRYKEKSAVCLGHGAASMFMAQQFFKMKMDEALAIRWHMGEYNVASNEIEELQQANLMYPLVYLIQFADRLACTEY